MTVADPTPEEILHFWFVEARGAEWRPSTPALDARIRRRFGRAIRTQCRRFREGGHPWLETPESAFALIVLLDQFPRHVWRGSNRAFSCDPLAREIARFMVTRGWDWAIEEERRGFVYLPFMHSEDIADQELSVELYRTRFGQGETDSNTHALAHREIIERFGRFPYRNAALGRSNTPEEAAWLESGGYRPG